MIRPLDVHPKLIRRTPLKHAKLGPAIRISRSHPQLQEKGPVTVCIACLSNWYFGPGDLGRAAITVSDRQITAGDVEYEPPQLKVSFNTKRTIIMIAGDYTIHTEALHQTNRIIAATSETDPANIAEIYAGCIRDVKFRHAANIYLSPLGLKSDIFSGQGDVSSDLLGSLADQVQRYGGPETSAIVVGADDFGTHIYLVDEKSRVSCHDDVGFVAIGLGAWHAKSQLMRARYTSQSPFATALALAYAAKKQAEVAPGVGIETDMFVVNRDGWMPVLAELKTAVEQLYNQYEIKINELASEQIAKLGAALEDIQQKMATQRAAEAASAAAQASPAEAAATEPGSQKN